MCISTKCCEWCTEVAGKYKFGEQPDGIFRRHDNCDCTIIYDGQVLRGKQNADGSRSKTWEELPNANAADYTAPTFSEAEGRAIEQRNLAQIRGLTNQANGGKIESKKCEIAQSKVENFFLKPGAKHADEFYSVGYTTEDAEKLTEDLKNCFDYSKAVDKSVTESGTEKFSIFADLGIDRKKRFRTVWQKDQPNSIPRIITAHREDD